MEYPIDNLDQGDVKKIAEGIFWLRLALPFRLNHVNVWIIDDDDGWAIIDSGIDNSATRLR
jgi:glyoxylase-like metal-dependent hydrolase (beta-lactamase superfamily II)